MTVYYPYIAVIGCRSGTDDIQTHVFENMTYDQAIAAFEDEVWDGYSETDRLQAWNSAGMYTFINHVLRSDSPIETLA